MKTRSRMLAASALLAAMSAGAGPENAPDAPKSEAAKAAASQPVLAAIGVQVNPLLSASALDAVFQRAVASISMETWAEQYGFKKEDLSPYKVAVRLDGRPRAQREKAVRVEVSANGDAGALTNEQREMSVQLANALAATVGEMLTQAAEDERANAAAKAVDDARRRLDESSERLGAYRAKLRAETGRYDVSAESVHAAMASLEQQRQSLELKLAGLEARQQAMQERVKRAAAQASARVEADEIAAELQKYVRTREDDYQRAQQMVKSGTVSAATAAEAEAKVAEAKVKLLERREAAGMGAAAVEPLVQDLEKLSLDVVEAQATLKAVKTNLERLSGATSLMDEYDSALSDRDRARRLLDQVETQRLNPQLRATFQPQKF